MMKTAQMPQALCVLSLKRLCRQISVLLPASPGFSSMTASSTVVMDQSCWTTVVP
ncbi:peroxidase 2 [Prunus dulcis]|uniref:Peroxidase 2 n=1 Tax=Prunus dulcis TaxID=3755 RepID=A0A4Y1RKC4_PRUDU|nr:peroxidase 2 [Prunus dulcis]